jgi:hypothetical protein
MERLFHAASVALAEATKPRRNDHDGFGERHGAERRKLCAGGFALRENDPNMLARGQ